MEYDSVRFNPGLGSDDLSSVPVKSGDPDGKRSVSASLFCPLSCTDRRDMKSDRCAGWGGGFGWWCMRVAEGRDSILLGAVRGDLKVS